MDNQLVIGVNRTFSCVRARGTTQSDEWRHEHGWRRTRGERHGDTPADIYRPRSNGVVMTNDRGSAVPSDCDPSLTEERARSALELSVETQLKLFSALSNETRLRILLLVDAAEDDVCGCELEPHLDVGQSSISHALSRLRESGLISRRKDGRWRYYSTTARAERVLGAITDTQAQLIDPSI